MGELVAEVLLRLSKAVLAALAGAGFWLLAVGPLAVEPSGTLVLLCWLSGAALVLLVQDSPI